MSFSATILAILALGAGGLAWVHRYYPAEHDRPAPDDDGEADLRARMDAADRAALMEDEL